MTRVEELQEIECLTAAYLSEDDPVWAMAEGCFQEVTNAHRRQAVLWLPSFKADKVVLVHLNFGGVFDEENSFVRGNEFPKDIQERCFLADEPTGNLDSKNGDSVMDLLRDIHQSGTTICMVTHDPRYANHAERTVHLFDGKIVEETQTAS